MLFIFMDYVALNYRMNENDEAKEMWIGFVVSYLKKFLQLLPGGIDEIH
jgi:hypothetical protein